MQRFLSYENMILAVVMMVSFINPFTSSALTTALPGIGTAYGATDAQLSWVIELFLISSTVTIMPISKIADRIGKRHIFLFGVSLFCVSSLAVYFVTSLYGLFVLRILQGLGSASIFATSMAIVSLVTPPERRGRAMGFTIAAVYCGLSFGPVLGGFFTYYLGWKTIFYFIAFICALAWLIAASKLIAASNMTKEEWIVNAKGSLDLPGSLLYALAMIAIMVGLSEITSHPLAKYILAAGILLFLAFLYGEWHRKSPVLPVRIFAGNRVFSCSSLAAMLNYCATFGISFLLSIYLQRITGLNARDTGLVLLIQPILMALLSPVTGSLSDRINPAVLASSGMILITVGLSLLAVNVSYPFFWLIAVALVIIGIGFALFTAPNNNAIMGSVTPKYYGAASSVVSTVRLIGQVLSVAIITLILSQSGAAATSAWLAQHIQQAFIVFTILCAIGIIPSAARSK